MIKFFHSLKTKLTLSFIIMILLISGLAFFYTFNHTKKALKEQMRTELMAVASAVAVNIDGDLHAGIKPGDEGTPAFGAIGQALLRVQKANDHITYIYTMRKTEEGAVFVVDPDPEEPCAIGEAYDEVNDEMLAGFQRPSADNEFVTDQWGTFLSGYAPIRDSLGNSVGLVGVDMTSKDVLAKQRFIGNTIYLIIGIAVLFAGFIILLFSGTIIKDVNRLNRIANRISMGDMEVKMDVRRNDEIGDLADSFGRMVASLKIVMMEKGESENKTEQGK
ncbi:MAG: HAMP domain-containing protein [Candidatus Edwardsbacteria bacterium]|nr:HAMP domain-containing protein [Candidatus Edwardsbacteria bacterium]